MSDIIWCSGEREAGEIIAAKSGGIALALEQHQRAEEEEKIVKKEQTGSENDEHVEVFTEKGQDSEAQGFVMTETVEADEEDQEQDYQEKKSLLDQIISEDEEEEEEEEEAEAQEAQALPETNEDGEGYEEQGQRSHEHKPLLGEMTVEVEEVRPQAKDNTKEYVEPEKYNCGEQTSSVDEITEEDETESKESDCSEPKVITLQGSRRQQKKQEKKERKRLRKQRNQNKIRNIGSDLSDVGCSFMAKDDKLRCNDAYQGAEAEEEAPGCRHFSNDLRDMVREVIREGPLVVVKWL
jgi:hypothetical protein